MATPVPVSSGRPDDCAHAKNAERAALDLCQYLQVVPTTAPLIIMASVPPFSECQYLQVVPTTAPLIIIASVPPFSECQYLQVVPTTAPAAL